MHGIIPQLFDCWANSVAHLLLPKELHDLVFFNCSTRLSTHAYNLLTSTIIDIDATNKNVLTIGIALKAIFNGAFPG